ncbi:carboxypeptidase-like regulatory domain-containing protein [Winogradskyella flava]|uniref:Carboxypeptidase-like regulatory domain-containing protein n=1 Tax=Winogradskyella flava TaxID=1884876 RepID=A0A842IT04_9FLAO|nr:carboxypeptidase-like regulatory domain-containing protein [Winogradskyella flava]MBC2844893.1 carboxypeptidase-like regulatory domain-containing protein [Winogradskyella flava]
MSKLRLIITVLVLFFSPIDLFGQTKTVSGQVLNEHLEPLSKVFIHTLDMQFKTTSDENGNYSITLPKDTKVLKIQCIGQESETIKVLNHCILNIILLDDIIAEFETKEEHLKDYIKRNKEIGKKYKRAIEKGLFGENKPCN